MRFQGNDVRRSECIIHREGHQSGSRFRGPHFHGCVGPAWGEIEGVKSCCIIARGDRIETVQAAGRVRASIAETKQEGPESAVVGKGQAIAFSIARNQEWRF